MKIQNLIKFVVSNSLVRWAQLLVHDALANCLVQRLVKQRNAKHTVKQHIVIHRLTRRQPSAIWTSFPKNGGGGRILILYKQQTKCK